MLYFPVVHSDSRTRFTMLYVIECVRHMELWYVSVILPLEVTPLVYHCSSSDGIALHGSYVAAPANANR